MTRKQRTAKSEAIHTLLAIKVDGYEAQADAFINYDVRQPQYSQHMDRDDPVFKYVTRLAIKGTAFYPEARVGNQFEITAYGDDSPSLLGFKESLQHRFSELS